MPRRKRDPLKEPTTPEAARAISHNLKSGRYAYCGRCELTFAAAKSDPPPDSVAGSVGRGRSLPVGACPECKRIPDPAASVGAVERLNDVPANEPDDEKTYEQEMVL